MYPYEHTHKYEDLLDLPRINGHTIVGEDKKDYDYDLQFKLNTDQMNAVNSGITSERVIDYDNYEITKQDKLTDTQLRATLSGITAENLSSLVNHIAELEDRVTALENKEDN